MDNSAGRAAYRIIASDHQPYHIERVTISRETAHNIWIGNERISKTSWDYRNIFASTYTEARDKIIREASATAYLLADQHKRAQKRLAAALALPEEEPPHA